MKNIIRECANPEFEFYFDCDCFNENAGNWNYTLFILTDDYYGYSHHYNGLNIQEYKRIREKMEAILEGFEDVEDRGNYADFSGFSSYKEAMEWNGIEYNSIKCHRLKEWAKNADVDDLDDFSDFLTIITGEKWNCIRVTGYCQGDFADVVYCGKYYPDKSAQIAGELYIGCGKEFQVIDVNEDGEETDCICGYYVADCQAWNDEDIKAIVCNDACIDPDETQLELIDGYSTHTTYNYRFA
jgi:hypothetical protein